MDVDVFKRKIDSLVREKSIQDVVGVLEKLGFDLCRCAAKR